MMLINGVLTSEIDATDRGLQYGDGLFETIAVEHGALQLWDAHMRRLQQGCERLAIPVPNMEQLRQEADQLMAINDGEHHQQTVLKIVITRGAGGRGYRAPEQPEPTRLLSLNPWPYSREQERSAVTQGVRLHICSNRLGENGALAGIKHLNRLEQVLARNEWSDPDISDGVVMNSQGEMIEGTMSNLFFVINGQLHTPSLTLCGVAGVMRAWIIHRLKQQGIDVTVEAIPLQRLIEVEEVFCCNSLMGIWPVRQIGGVCFNAPGTVTQDCIHHLEQAS